MSSNIDELLRKIKSLEQELIVEIQNQQLAFTYEIRQRRIFFEKQVILQQNMMPYRAKKKESYALIILDS